MENSNESGNTEMHLSAGVVISGLMIGTPLAFQVNITQPPVNLTGWLIFAISLGGVLSPSQAGVLIRLDTKLVINPAIQAQLTGIPSRKEFEAHVKQDDDFQKRVDGFIENYYEGSGVEHRHGARRRGDPQ